MFYLNCYLSKFDCNLLSSFATFIDNYESLWNGVEANCFELITFFSIRNDMVDMYKPFDSMLRNNNEVDIEKMDEHLFLEKVQELFSYLIFST